MKVETDFGNLDVYTVAVAVVSCATCEHSFSLGSSDPVRAVEEALGRGWTRTNEGRVICPTCAKGQRDVSWR